MNQQTRKLTFQSEERRQWTNKCEFQIKMGMTKTIKKDDRVESYLYGKGDGSYSNWAVKDDLFE